MDDAEIARRLSRKSGSAVSSMEVEHVKAAMKNRTEEKAAAEKKRMAANTKEVKHNFPKRGNPWKLVK